MKAVVTGGGGFVMANFLRHWLEADPKNTAVCLDAAPLDAAAQRYFEPVLNRLETVQGDVADARTWQQLPADTDYVVHGAAVTSHAYTDASGRRRDPERENPLQVLSTNILGTGQALEWARDLRGLRRFVYVSTGSVYVDAVPEQEHDPFPLPEDGYIGPHLLYDISKYSSELIVRRLTELHALAAYTVRLSSVFGPMDRPTPARNVRNIANFVAHAAAEGRAVRAISADAVGDYVYAPDVADALYRLLRAPAKQLRHDVYNIACGKAATIRDLIACAQATAPNLSLEITGADKAEIQVGATRRTGRWGAYDISRAEADFGWRPRALGDALRDYIAWLRENRQ
jgi:UDP-glucose 4-epimerase